MSSKKIAPYKIYHLRDSERRIRQALGFGFSDVHNTVSMEITGDGSPIDYKISYYAHKINIDDCEQTAEIKAEGLIEGLENLHFFSFTTGEIRSVGAISPLYYDLKYLHAGHIGILYAPNNEFIRPHFYHTGGDLLSIDSPLYNDIIRADKGKQRVIKIAHYYSDMVKSPDSYGSDWAYLEKILKVADDIPVMACDIFRAWHYCPDMALAIRWKFLDKETVLDRIKNMENGINFMPETISYGTMYAYYQNLGRSLYDEYQNWEKTIKEADDYVQEQMFDPPCFLWNNCLPLLKQSENIEPREVNGDSKKEPYFWIRQCHLAEPATVYGQLEEPLWYALQRIVNGGRFMKKILETDCLKELKSVQIKQDDGEDSMP